MSRFASAPWPFKAVYLTSLAALTGAVAVSLAAGVALAGLRQLHGDLQVAEIPSWFWYFRQDPQVRRWAAIGAATAALSVAAAIGGLVSGVRPPLHGAARWASEAEVRAAGLRAATGILLGRRNGRPLVFGGPEHVLLYAPTRTGKGVGVVIPNLLSWPGSVVVLDVKRENWDATAGFRQAHGQAAHLFDPLEPEGRTARFNPLGHIDRSDPAEVLDELQKLAVMLFPAPPHADPFWAEAARTGFIGVGAYVAETPDLPFSLGQVYVELTHGDPRQRLAAELARRRAAGRPLSAGCTSALGDFCSASENTFASIKQTITARMNLWLSPRVCAATETSDFDLRDLRTKPMSLYLAVSPDNLTRVAPLYNLLFQQLVDLNTRERPNAERHPLQVLVLLDEFAKLGHAETLAKAFAFVAGYGLRLLPVLQSPAQLKGQYGPELAEEITANCGVEVAFAPKELKVAQDLSARLGAYTYRARSRSRPAGLGRGRATTSDSDQRRPLRLPQELIQMPQTDLLILKAGVPPIRGRKIVYWRERLFTRRIRRAPTLPPRPLPATLAAQAHPTTPRTPDPLTLDLDPQLLAALDPPPQGASPEVIEAWIDRFIDQGARLPEVLANVR